MLLNQLQFVEINQEFSLAPNASEYHFRNEILGHSEFVDFLPFFKKIFFI